MLTQPQYCRAAPIKCFPCSGRAVSSTTSTPSSPPTRVAAFSTMIGQTANHPVSRGSRSRSAWMDPPHRRIVPGCAGNEVMKLVVAAKAQLSRGRLQALTLARANQALQVDRRLPSPLPVPHRRRERCEPVLQILPPVHLRHRLAPSNGHDTATAQVSQRLANRSADRRALTQPEHHPR